MIRDQNTVFLGAVVQPKTKEPIWVQRSANTFRSIDILTRGPYEVYTSAGAGYLDGGDMGNEYLNSVEITGYPRCHTPSGVKVAGGGYGTCLYTGLVLLASSISARELYQGYRMPGSGAGISSDSESRSEAANAWWSAAYDRDLTQQKEGEAPYGDEDSDDTEVEDLEDEDLTEYMSQRSYSTIKESIVDAVTNYGGEWTPHNIHIRGDVQRDVPKQSGGYITADYYTLRNAELNKMVVVRQTAEGQLMDWAMSQDYGGVYYPEVILALNVSKQDPRLVGRLAACAIKAGASEPDVTAMVMRNRFGVDLLKKSIGRKTVDDMELARSNLVGAGVLLDDPREHAGTDTSASRTRNPGRKRRRFRPMRELPPIAVRRNPTEVPTGRDKLDLERALAKLERRRDDLGWNNLEELP